MNYWDQKFLNYARLMEVKNQSELKNLHIAVIGIGGVGSWAVESIARCGVENITLVDLDEVCASNFNRQLHGVEENIGQSKVEVMQKRILDINDRVKVNAINDFYTKANTDILPDSIDGIIDAIDGVRSKCELLAYAHKKQIPIVSVGAAGGRTNPLAIEVKDITKTFNDNLLRRIRKKLKREYGLPPNKKWGIPSVFSKEVIKEVETCDTDTSVKARNCQNGLGTAVYITSMMGMIASYVLIDKLLNNENN